MRLAPVAAAVALGALGPGRPVAGAASEAAWDPPPCPEGAASAAPGVAGTAWYRMDPVLDAAGTLAARRLDLGIAGEPALRIDLPPESFASGPVAGRVLAGDDDGVRSRLRLLDPGIGCGVTLAQEADVIRSAVLAPAGDAVLEHRVDRVTRADLGIWRRSLGAGPAVRLLAGLDPDPSFGPTFTTDLLVAPDGRVVVSSCGLDACRVRVLDPATGGFILVGGTGPALGVSGASAIVRAACPGQPCPVEAVDLATGRHSLLIRDALAAVLGGPRGDRIVAETPGGAVVVVDPASGKRTRPAGASGSPLARGSTATAGVDTPRGAVALAPGGRPDATTTRVLEPVEGTSHAIEEVAR
jgi:hypothetical protein